MKQKILIYALFIAFGLVVGYLVPRTVSNSQETHNEITPEAGVWTCSMHPQIFSDTEGKCPLCAMDLVFMEKRGSSITDQQFEMTKSAISLANIQTFQVGMSNVSISKLRLSGLVKTNVETDAIQTTLFDGRIDQLYTNYVGKKVYQGQQIGLVYSPELYLAQDKLLTSKSYKESHPKLYNAARNSLGLWKMTDAQIDELLETGKPMVNFPMYADVNGTITEMIAKEGNFYKQGDPLFKVSDLRKVWAVFDAYEDQLPYLKVGQPVEVSVKGSSGKKIQTKIAFIEPLVNSHTRTAMVRIVLNNRKGLLKPGMFVDGLVDISNESKQQLKGVMIPKSAVLWTGKRSLVYKKPFPDQSIFEIQEVELGASVENEYEILSGLEIGDHIVVEGAFTVDAAAQLTGKKSMMTIRPETNHNKHIHKELEDVPKPIQIESDFGKDFSAILANYFDLKDALVGSEFNKSKEIIIGISEEYTLVETKHKEHSNLVTNMGRHIKMLVESKTIDEVRMHFKPFSAELIKVTKALNLSEKSIYVQFCPMADENKGAFWMSFQEEIRNPYFGEKMLICGTVEERIN